MKRIITLTLPNPAILKAFMFCLAMVAGLGTSYSNLNLDFSETTLTESESFASCDNVTSGGKIGSPELVCGPFDPAVIENLESPSGGWGTLEFLWLKSTNPELPWDQWTIINGADGDSYNPGSISETTYFLRCSRREGCSYYYGESNIIAKVVAPVDTNCTSGTLTTNTSFAKTVAIDGHVSYEQNALGAPDGQVAKFYDENDYLVVEMEEEIKAGESIVITWKYRHYTSSFSGPSQLEVWWSADGSNFTKETTLSTYVKTFLVSQSVTLSNDARYIKLKNGLANPDFEVDAISYCQSTCEIVCDNVTNGGKIVGDEFSCGGFQSATITSLELPSGGSGQIEYFWLKTNDPALPALEWDTAAIGSTIGATLDPGFISETTYFIRCSRRYPCELWIGESNPIAKVVVDNSSFVCELGSGTPSGFTAGNGSALDTENGAIDGNKAIGAPDGEVAKLYNAYDFIQIDLGETLQAGETYVISWKAKTQGFTVNPAKLNISESTDNTDFTLANTSETFVKYTMIHETFTTTKDTRYLKLQQADGSIEIEIDAISYCKAECPECDNVTDGGEIGSNEFGCGGYDAAIIGNIEAPSGGSGQIEYFWLRTTDPSLPALEWDTAAIGSTIGATFDPGFISETTYFIRCSRRYPCELWIGESNPIAKVVVDNSSFVCELGSGTPSGFTAGNGSALDTENGAIDGNKAIGAPDGEVAKLYNAYDFIQIDLGETLQAGETYVISWKAKTQGFTVNPAKLNISESTDNTDFTLANTSETFVKYTMIHETFTTTKDTRYLKLQQADGSIEIEIDAISYCKAECPECDNVTSGGKIGFPELVCGPFDPAVIENLESPSGGWGALEFLWLKSTNPELPWDQWTIINGADGDSYNPGSISETTYFLRCSRREGCSYYYGESNIIAKVVAPVDTNCTSGTLTTNMSFAKTVAIDGHVSYEQNALGAPDGQVAKFYDENDYLVVEMEEEIKAGESIVITWKYKHYTSSFSGPSQLEVWWSADGSNFTKETTLSTYVKTFLVSQSVTLSNDARYIKLKNGLANPDFEVDAISYCQSTCEVVCDNVTNGGKIAGDEFSCGGFQSATITSLELPSGGSGDIEYFWLKTNDPALPALEWDTAAIGSTIGATFDPGFISETTYFIRCSRRYPCELWIGESNPIAKVVVDNSSFACELGSGTPSGFTAGNGSALDTENGAIDGTKAIGAPDGEVAKLYNAYDFIQIDLGETLQAGETYVISWKAKTQGFTVNPAKLNISESTDNTDFTLANTSETFVKYTMIHETFTTTKDTRYLKLQQADGSIEIEIDAISYCKAECPECDNITDGGKIGSNEFGCGGYDAAIIGNIEAPSGGSGQIEYFWLRTTDPSLPALEWDTAAIGAAVGPTLDPGFISETTYFIRCSRRYPCDLWIGESNPIAKVVVDNTNLCLGGEILSSSKGYASAVDAENGVDFATKALGAADDDFALLYDDNDYITLDLGETIKAGQTYVISWKARTQGFTVNPAKLAILESDTGSDFSLNTSLETFVKFTTIHSSLIASRDLRYLRLEKTAGFIEIEIDAVTYGQATCNFPTICELNDHGKADKGDHDRLIWLKNHATGDINEYSMNISDSRFTQFLNGSALLTGTAENIHDDCDIWTYSVRLIEKQNWADWSTAGGSFKPNNKINNEDHTTWDYYKLDNNNSTFTGEGCNTGEVLNLTHRPADFEFGFQVGIGANLKNGDYGISGWFSFTGSYTGRGDFNGNLENCVDKSALLNIGDFVWEDLNGNGVQDAGEPGIQGVQAQLIGTDLVGNGIDIIAFTDENGAYNFGPLNPGTYKVIFSNLPGAYFATSKSTGGDAKLDSDADPITGTTPNRVYGGGQNDDTVDAGYIRFAEIGDFVWEDKNANGIFDFGEPMIEGVEVQLTGTDSRNQSIDRNATTNEAGIYFFNELYPGSYKLTFTPPAGFEATAKNIGTDPTLDSDIDPSTNMTDVFVLESGESNGNFDVGLLQRINISGIVFDDKEDDGLRNNSDTPVEGFKVNLLRKDEFGVFQPYESDFTLADGSFWFLNLPPAEYKITADAASLPADFNFSQLQDVDANVSDDIDNDANGNGMIENITLVSGQADLEDLGIAIVFNAILPVELVEFNAQVIEGNQTLLNWVTESELNNKHFVIERSIDGQVYNAIGIVEGNGTSNNINYYSYIDETPFYGRNYYRLKQIDFDGKFDLSEVKSIVIEADLPDAILYPNPTKAITTMRVVSPFIADATLEIVSVTGQILRTEVIPTGTNSLEIDLTEYQSGFYFINISYDGFKKMVHRVLKTQD